MGGYDIKDILSILERAFPFSPKEIMRLKDYTRDDIYNFYVRSKKMIEELLNRANEAYKKITEDIPKAIDSLNRMISDINAMATTAREEVTELAKSLEGLKAFLSDAKILNWTREFGEYVLSLPQKISKMYSELVDLWENKFVSEVSDYIIEMKKRFDKILDDINEFIDRVEDLFELIGRVKKFDLSVANKCHKSMDECGGIVATRDSVVHDLSEIVWALAQVVYYLSNLLDEAEFGVLGMTIKIPVPRPDNLASAVRWLLSGVSRALGKFIGRFPKIGEKISDLFEPIQWAISDAVDLISFPIAFLDIVYRYLVETINIMIETLSEGFPEMRFSGGFRKIRVYSIYRSVYEEKTMPDKYTFKVDLGILPKATYIPEKLLPKLKRLLMKLDDEGNVVEVSKEEIIGGEIKKEVKTAKELASSTVETSEGSSKPSKEEVKEEIL